MPDKQLREHLIELADHADRLAYAARRKTRGRVIGTNDPNDPIPDITYAINDLAGGLRVLAKNAGKEPTS